MTAEIAILNKSAVALAADSAITISAGQAHEKIFDSGEKLFELSSNEPIGIMIYNGMSFMEFPIPNLVRQFRECNDSFDTVEDAGYKFLEFLNDVGRASPTQILNEAVAIILAPILNKLYKRHQKIFLDKLFSVSSESAPDFEQMSQDILSELLDDLRSEVEYLDDAEFVGLNRVDFDDDTIKFVRSIVGDIFHEFSEDARRQVVETSKLLLVKRYFSQSRTGIVFAGFGENERFPTLVSYEIDGIILDGLKFRKAGCYDIDRTDLKAAVLPFAQQEMVDRFLYGLDDDIQSSILKFCRESVSQISDEILEKAPIKGKKEKTALLEKARDAERAFLNGLEERAFESIRLKSKREIEDMVEFMPKPELAKMAEALVELTSIKRRVTRGMETVGGPIDVAVISKTEGFVWVKRKHYFPRELNARYFERVRRSMSYPEWEASDGEP